MGKTELIKVLRENPRSRIDEICVLMGQSKCSVQMLIGKIRREGQIMTEVIEVKEDRRKDYHRLSLCDSGNNEKESSE